MWWRYIIPPMYGFVYLSICASTAPLKTAVIRLVWFTLTIIATAAFGYFLNDWSDIEQDAEAGKPNRVAGLSPQQRVGIAFLLLVCSWAPWIALPRNSTNMTFMVLQYVAFVSYSCPPFRLKERSQWGLICDMLYGHLIPIVVTVATFNDDHSRLQSWTFYAFLLPWLVCKGLRNIATHQVNDRSKDRKAGVRTLVLKMGPLRTIKAINYVILPLEILSLSALLVLLATYHLPLYAGFIGFLIFTCLKFSIWRVPSLSIRKRWFKFLYFMNDFYEEWLPLTALVVLAMARPESLVLIAAHFCMFPWLIAKFRRDLVVIRTNVMPTRTHWLTFGATDRSIP